VTIFKLFGDSRLFNRDRIPNFWTRLKDMYIITLGLIGIKWQDPSRLTYIIPKSVMKLAKEAGLKRNDDFLEFWFKNRNSIIYEVNSGFVGGQISSFEKTHQWLTPIGRQCSKSLQLFINSNQNKFPISDSHYGRKRRLDVSNFTFEFKSEIFNLEKFHRYLNLIPCNRRIDLSGVRIKKVSYFYLIVALFDTFKGSFENDIVKIMCLGI
jgi:hypothetical protein